jgi:murein L,D-transpeptidase YafK
MTEYIDPIYTIMSITAQRGQKVIPMHMFPFPMREATVEKALLAYPQHVNIFHL